MKNNKIYKMEAFSYTTKRFKMLYIGDAYGCFEMKEDHADEFKGDEYCYYLTGFVDGLLQTIAVDARDEVHEYNLEL